MSVLFVIVHKYEHFLSVKKIISRCNLLLRRVFFNISSTSVFTVEEILRPLF